MSHAHSNSDLLLANRPVVIDSPLTSYFPFNNSLVSQGTPMYPLVDPISGAMSGASNAIEGVLQQYDHSSLIVLGKFGNGVTIDEDTINIASSKTSFLGWGQYSGAVVTVTQNQVVPEWNTTQAVRIQSTGGTNTLKYYTTVESPSVSGQSYTATCYIKNNGLAAVTFRTQIGNSVVVQPGEVKLCICTGTGNGTSGYQLRFQTAGVADLLDIFAYRPQVEKKGYYTSYTDNSRSTTYLTYPNYPIRTASLWVKSTSNKVVDGIDIPRTILRQVDQNDSYPRWTLYAENTNTTDTLPGTATAISAGSAVLKVEWKTNGVDVTTFLCAVDGTNILDGNWHHITCEFGVPSYASGTVCRIWVDDGYGETLNIAETNYSFPGQLRMGYDSTSELAGNFIIDELRLDSKSYSYDDIRRRFIANTEYYNPYSLGITCT